MLRSLLFVPGDRPDRMAKAAASGADALILDLEDAVTLERKAEARAAVAAFLAAPCGCRRLVRVNPLDSGLIADDLAAVLPAPSRAPSKRPMTPSPTISSAPAARSRQIRPSVAGRIAQGSRLGQTSPLARAWNPGSM